MMNSLLAVPGVGFVENSVNVHRSDVMVVADWVEGTAIFFDRAVSRMEVRDFLYDNNYYQDQSYAMTFVDLVWAELRRRILCMNAYPVFQLHRNKVQTLVPLARRLGYAFCLMLTFLQRYSEKQHPDLHCGSFVQQGDLFERLSEESFSRHGWKTLRTGWASGISNANFRTIINDVANELNESWINNAAIPVFRDAKEEGLDLVVHRPFTDRAWVGPTFLCSAQAANWEDKLHTPRIEVWNKLVVFTTDPRRAFCFPLGSTRTNFRKACVKCTGMLLDRYRLLSSGTALSAHLSGTLQRELKTWLTPRVAGADSLTIVASTVRARFRTQYSRTFAATPNRAASL